MCLSIGLYLLCQHYGADQFRKAEKIREQAVIARLIDIRKAQTEYRNLNNLQYTPSFDTLIHFVKTAKLPFIYKKGELTDKQMEDGLTEKKAVSIINKAKKTGNYAEVKNGDWKTLSVILCGLPYWIQFSPKASILIL